MNPENTPSPILAGSDQPSHSAITTNMILAIAFAEALGIYALIVAVILLFVI